MASMAPPSEPTNAELMAVLQTHIATSQASAREQAAAMGELKSEVSAVRAKVHEVEGRVHRVETENRRLRDSQAELEGSLLREVGALASNDQKQNGVLAAIKLDVSSQGKKIDGLVEQTKDAIAADLKKVARKYGGYCLAAILGAPKFWEVATWVAHFFGKALT